MTTSSEVSELDEVFGAGSSETPFDRARESKRTFVRSLDQLAFYSQGATGRQLTALEALNAYGFDILKEVASEGSALLCASRDAAGYAIRCQRESLGLSRRAVAARVHLAEHDIERAETHARDVRLRTYERIAACLGMDERYLSVRREPTANQELAVRLRTIGDSSPTMTPTTVTALAEAAWVAATQLRLENELSLPSRRKLANLQPSTNYGSPGYPAYRHGYYLASTTRQQLSLGTNPISSMRQLCEDIGIVVVQAELGEWIAGATIEVSTDVRAIVLNVSGGNHDVFVRRATMAHELEHLLYDPAQHLNRLRVDEFDELERPASEVHDRIEQRANAFAVAFLAPQEEATDLFRSEGLETVIDHFGLSFTAARYHIWNGLERDRPLEALTARRRRPSEHWVGAEQYTVDYHPLKTAISRCGRFSGVVIRAASEELISWDTAAEYLQTGVSEVKAATSLMKDLFPSAWM